jgi:hypothetical protein
MQVHDREKSEDVDVYIAIENNRTTGFALIASEPRQFTIINIVGSVARTDLPKIENYLHLPAGKVGLGRVDEGRVDQGGVNMGKPSADAGWPANTL